MLGNAIEHEGVRYQQLASIAFEASLPKAIEVKYLWVNC